MTLFWHKIVRIVGYAIATIIILTAVAVSVGRLFTPLLMEHRADFERFASGVLHTPVTIKKVHISWYYFRPELSLDEVEVLDSETHKPTFKIQEINVSLEIIKSLLKRQLIPAYIKLSGMHVTIKEQIEGQVKVVGLGSFSIKDNMTGAHIGANAVGDWLLAQRHLVLDDIEFVYIPLAGDVKSITLHKLSLKNSGLRHELDGAATLNQDIPTDMLIDFKWHGATFDLTTISAHLYIYLEAVSLPQWIKDRSYDHLRINQGLGSAKVSADWNHNQWQAVETEFQLYELELQSLLTQKSQIVSRLNGRVGWKREGDQQTLYGEDILIDFPEHIWPTTRFSITTSMQGDKKQLTALQVGYLDLADSRELILASGLFKGKLEDVLTALNPAGEVRAVNVHVNDPLNHLSDSFSAECRHLSIEPWHKLPGLRNFSGTLAWDGVAGDVAIDSEMTQIEFNTVFNNPLVFNRLSGHIHGKKNNDSTWVLQGVDLKASNADLDAAATVDLTLIKNQSPAINLRADFTLKNAAKINDYLPEKIFDADLSNWLNHAFVGGRIESGQAILQGHLNEFPFDHGTGKFMVSGLVRDMDFHFAPKWPAILQLDGRLEFSGRQMTVDIDTGHLLRLPLKNIHGVIPYIGSDHPQVLEVNGMIHGDLTEALEFIHGSPLQKSIGNELSMLQLSGPMQLKLGLSIPLKTPEKTRVLGDVMMHDANLRLPAWNIVLSHLAGALQFSENSLNANQLTGRMLNYPITIHIDTLKKANSLSSIQAILKSQMTIVDLQKLLGFDLSKLAQGSLNYVAEINLMPKANAKPSQLILRTNLQGVTLNLPDKFSKKAEELRPVEMVADLGQVGAFATKIRYADLLTAAVTLLKNNEKTTFQSGEIRFGKQGAAALQTQPGLLVTGQVERLDWDAIKDYSTQFAKEHQTTTMSTNLLREINIKANQVIAFGQVINNAQVKLISSENNWVASIDSQEMLGDIIIPRDPKASAIQAKFQRFTLKSLASSHPIDPKTLPALSFLGDDVLYNDMHLGRVALDIEPTTTGLIIKSLRLNTALYRLSLNGQWWSQKSGERTRIEGNLNTTNVTDFLNTFGVKSTNLVDSGGSAVFDLTWPEAPYHPTMKGMNGYLDLKLTKGRIVDLGESTDAKMGLGRMLNIFSLQALPRRLSFDFSDLFQKGYSFDSLNGNFTFKDGSAFTDNTRFDGPMAQVLINGRIGFAVKDFDLRLRITPYVTSSLPLVATAIGGPVAGAVTFVLNKAVGSAVSKVTTYQYRVTGPWDNPNWSESH